MRPIEDNALAIVADAASTVVGRIGSFLFAVWLSALGAAFVWAGQWQWPGWGEVLMVPFGWLVTVFLAPCQWWGFLSYGALAVLFVEQVHLERPLRLTLPAAMAIQALETTRFCCCDSASWPLRAVILMSVLGVILFALAVLYVRRTWLGRPAA